MGDPETEQRDRLWALLDNSRARAPHEMLSVLAEQRPPLAWRDVATLGGWRPEFESLATVADAELVERLIEPGGAVKVLDPAASIGTLLAALDEAELVEEAVGVVASQSEFGYAAKQYDDARFRWVLGRHALDNLPRDFDLVVSAPPIKMLDNWYRERYPALRSNLAGTYGLVLDALGHLAPDGRGLCLLDGALFGERGRELRGLFAHHGFHVEAAFAMPARRLTSVSLYLVSFSQQAVESVWVGRYDPATDVRALLNNYKHRRPSAVPDLGALVSIETFTSLRQLELTDSVERQAREMGFRPMPLAGALVDIVLGKGHEPFVERPNAVYLPALGTADATTGQGALRVTSQNVFQLVLRFDVVDAGFLARLLNTRFGRQLRERWLSSTTIPRINKSTLLASELYLPPPELQVAVAATRDEIDRIRQRLDELENQLWNQPAEAAKVRRALTRLDERRVVDAWLDDLPFPLASILRRYRGRQDAEARCIAAVNLFEATTVFAVAVLLSGVREEPTLYEQVRRQADRRLSYVSIGTWVHLLEDLGGIVRPLLQRESDLDLVARLFRTRIFAAIEALASPRLSALLAAEANTYRKDWTGHGAPVSRREWATRSSLAEGVITQLREILGDSLADWPLVRLRGGVVPENGIMHTTVDRLVGPNPAFDEDAFDLLDLLEAHQLYLVDPFERRALRLVPLVRMMAGPEEEEDACYFFSRLEAGTIRWLSYHHTDEASREDMDPATAVLIREITTKPPQDPRTNPATA
jgi:hypothetical protein